MAATEPGKIRNVAVVGHRGTGKTSLVEALLFQTGEVNRLGTIEAGTTVSDSDEDEQQRARSRSRSRSRTRSGRAARSTSLDCPGDPSFQGEARCALRVVEGALVVVSGVMGFEVGTARVKKLAEELGLARVLVVNMLDRERADFFRTLGQIQEQFSSKCVAVHIPIGAEHELEGIVDVLHMCAYMSPNGQKEGDPVAIPGRDAGARAGVPREAPRRGRPDRRGADGALPRGRGARPARRRGRAQARRHARRDLPRRLLGRHEEPRHACAPRPAGRGRPLAGEARRAVRRRRSGRPQRSCSRRSPTRSPGRSTSSAC